MAPIKFEEKIKDKLEKRTITPSADSWSKLSKRLDEDTKSNSPRLFWWLGIAASLILMMALAIQFFGNESEEAIIPELVEEPSIEAKSEGLEMTSETNLKSVEVAEIKMEESEGKEDPQSVVMPERRSNPTTIVNKDVVAEVVHEKSGDIEILQLDDPKKINQPEIEVALTKESIAEIINDLNTDKKGALDREIDSLLKLANKELIKSNRNKVDKVIVDAKALLESVEDDMGQSFRTKIFEALKDSYETVKTAVAERNN